MRTAYVAIVAFGLGLVSTAASAGFGPGASYGFTSAFVGAWSGGSVGTQVAFEPGPGFSLPTLVGDTMTIPIPLGHHSSHWWRVFTAIETQQAAALLGRAASATTAAASTAGAAASGLGTPGPVAGSGLPFLAAAGAAWLLRRRRPARAAA